MPVIKRYTNRKLYDTETKRYVTLEDLAEMVRRGDEVRVVDHNSGEDLTSVTLMQVIFEEEKKIGGLLPQVFLTRLIRSGNDAVSALRSRVGKINPFQMVDEEIRRRVEALVQEDRLSDEEGARLLDLLTSKPEETQAVRIPVQSDEDPADTDAADVEELSALEKQVALLEQELARMRGEAQDTATA